MAIVASITWILGDRPIAMNPARSAGPGAIRPPGVDPASADPERGRAVYAEKFADRHAEDGQARKANPPVRGDRSYNHGAGLAQASQLAA